MRIGILDSGEESRKIGESFIELGHTIKIGSRNPKKDEIIQWINKNNNNTEKASFGTFSETAKFEEVIVIATLWDGIINAIKMAEQKNFDKKVVIDVTNPLDFSNDVPPRLALGFSNSSGETLQRLISSAKVVKAFNTVGNPHFIPPNFPNGRPPAIFICGNDDSAKRFVTKNILSNLGWKSMDIEGIEGSRLLEPLTFLWIICYFKTGSGNLHLNYFVNSEILNDYWYIKFFEIDMFWKYFLFFI
jgi:8-hydroxy-5-deazaflavin:NADPH oxidoreductase